MQKQPHLSSVHVEPNGCIDRFAVVGLHGNVPPRVLADQLPKAFVGLLHLLNSDCSVALGGLPHHLGKHGFGPGLESVVVGHP